ncbi:hypothetical protein D9619_007650 [Psilocybe cf. subviscida]|uniref:Uncharacterized protein n=1 Tax=Psilocybe cf. subviscida TaxID=2480587 RepID=A0A8H5ESR6_9AGAR|nr:hypothetical protein D9619_007650 [Psilocybe cf. subviscida]
MFFSYLSSIISSVLQHTRISLPFYEAGDEKALQKVPQANPLREEFGFGSDLEPYEVHGRLSEQTCQGDVLSYISLPASSAR